MRASHDALVELFERIESFFKRLGVYTQISLTTGMAEVLVKIVAEILSVLSIATKEMKRKRTSELFLHDILLTYSNHSQIWSGIYFRKLLGRTDIEDALKRLDNLIQDEVRMAMAQTMKATIDHKDGAQPLQSVAHLTLNVRYPTVDAKKTDEVVQQMANDVGEIKCS